MKIAIIIPIYNAEEYLVECIRSVINQTVSFEEYCTLILVNDGSTDTSEEICLHYKSKFPNNILYFNIENSGPSVARNVGLRNIPNFITHITFLDSDDRLEANAVEAVYKFFNSYPHINIATMPVTNFESIFGPIKLNKRFNKGTNVIDISKNYTSPQFYIGGVVINTKVLELHSLTFDENLRFWEDALFVNKIILIEGKYGLISNTNYWYRKRKTNDSLVDTAWHEKSRYTNFIKNSYMTLLKESQNAYNEVIPYVQYLVIYHLKLFLFQKNSSYLMNTLDSNERIEFINEVKLLLNKIDEKYIIEQNTKNIHKEFLLSLKFDSTVTLESFNDIDPNSAIKILKTKISGLNLLLYGYFSDDNYIKKKEDKIFIKYLNQKRYAQSFQIKKKHKIWGLLVRDYKHSGFVIKLPVWCLGINFRFGIVSSKGIANLRRINLFMLICKKVYRNLKKKF
jgi:glycosyltransferase involved in cell wall biosynthesis